MEEARTTWIEIKPEDMFSKVLWGVVFLGWFIVFFALGLGLVFLFIFLEIKTTADGVWSMDPIAILTESALALVFAQITIRKELRRWKPLKNLGSRALAFDATSFRCASCLARNAITDSEPSGDYLEIPWSSIRAGKLTRAYRNSLVLEITADQPWIVMLPPILSMEKKQMIRQEFKERGK
jgi:hypothetical protein